MRFVLAKTYFFCYNKGNLSKFSGFYGMANRPLEFGVLG